MKNKVIYFLFGVWVWIGHKVFGWHYIDVYAPNNDRVIGITFSQDKKYIKKVNKII